jgi:glucosamine--fructose-6-phosphate aminotransferase (isomerizing)
VTGAHALGATFEAEIRQQPDVWRRIADGGAAGALAAGLNGAPVLFVGSGSSLFVAQLAALAFRRRGVRAAAVAATEARFDPAGERDATVVALSQSGESADLLAAIALLRPARLIAVTNDARSSLAALAQIVIDVAAGPERAVPASKSVTAMVAVVLWAASLAGGRTERSARGLHHTADAVAAWLDGPDAGAVAVAAGHLATSRGVIVVGAGYGVPIANEIALKIKEASYVHAEGFPAGEFRHGSSAVLDASMAIVGIVDEASRASVDRPLTEAASRGATRYAIGARLGEVALLGPLVHEAFNTLAWLVTGQRLALELGRARGVDSDAPRGLAKALT